jgi:hypothetical protein
MIKKLLIILFFIVYLVNPAFAEGIIIGWDDTIANIPLGWSLCDGNGGRPNLLDKYLKSVGAAENPGATGGTATHSHTSPAHNHTQDAHSHSGNSGNASGGSIYTQAIFSDAAGKDHNHSITLASTTATNQTATVTLDVTSNDPPYYKLAFIYDSAVNRYPVGSVILWGSATLPTGWTVHTGLKNVYAKSVGSGENPGGTGGSSNAHTHTNTPHNHIQDAHSHSTSHGNPSSTGHNGSLYESLTVSAWSHSHSVSSDSITATNQSSSVTISNADGQPPYYKLSYIKNTGAAANRPKNSIVNWSGTIANIPSGYVLCDGTNGTPDLRNYFVKGASTSGELGNTGGSLQHDHTASSHNHTQNPHTHTVSALGNATAGVKQGSGSQYESLYPATHGHTGCTVTNTATNQATTITVNNCVSGAAEPPYYKIAYIMQTQELDVGAYAFMVY